MLRFGNKISLKKWEKKLAILTKITAIYAENRPN
jgi:hypothetical protein